MARKLDNVVLTQAAAEELRKEFIGWQCRLRQLAARQDAGRLSRGMCPRATTLEGALLSPGLVVLIVEADPQISTDLFRHQYQRTQDPRERYDKILEILQGSYFQQPVQFSDVMTALFGPGATMAAQLCSRGRCILEFTEHAAGYRLPCRVERLGETDKFYQATYWHSRLFNPHLPMGVEVLSFAPDWRHASRHDTGS